MLLLDNKITGGLVECRDALRCWVTYTLMAHPENPHTYDRLLRLVRA